MDGATARRAWRAWLAWLAWLARGTQLLKGKTDHISENRTGGRDHVHVLHRDKGLPLTSSLWQTYLREASHVGETRRKNGSTRPRKACASGRRACASTNLQASSSPSCASSSRSGPTELHHLQSITAQSCVSYRAQERRGIAPRAREGGSAPDGADLQALRRGREEQVPCVYYEIARI